MSVSEEQELRPAAAATSDIADPAPLGLAAFALTTFLFSAKNANWMSHAGGLTFIGYAFAYGGFIQLLAGMWEFRNKNVFGCTAFSSYGGFWIGAALWIELHGVHDTAAQFNHDVGWINLAFLIFNTYMMIMSLQINTAVFVVFLTLGLTELFLAIGFFSAGAAATTGLIQFAGYIGIVTAIAAWYTSAAGVANGIGGRIKLPVGKPLFA